jgi:hypothetical protein
MLVSLPQPLQPTPVAGSRQPVPPPPQPYPYPSQPPVALDVVVEDGLAVVDPDVVAAIAPPAPPARTPTVSPAAMLLRLIFIPRSFGFGSVDGDSPPQKVGYRLDLVYSLSSGCQAPARSAATPRVRAPRGWHVTPRHRTLAVS